MTVEYRVLGPLAVRVDGHPVAVTAGRDRIVLAMLLLHPNRVVGAGELVEAVWGPEPPATARGQLQSCVSRLRRLLPDGVIGTDPAGYRIVVGPGELDAAVFAQATRDRAGLRAALELWRGPACAELDAPMVRHAAAALDERFALAVEDWADLELAAGNERELASELGGFVERFPLRERLRGQLMLALARSGRQADALAEFRRARELLAEELGIEPGEELQKRHREVLNGEVAAEVRVGGPVRCLPRTVGDFTGRTEQLDRLLTELAADIGPAAAVIDGMAGSGKTTLALHLAGLLGDRYPDAHLYVDLQGHSEGDPVEPSAALLALLRQLGLAAAEIPLERADRVALWRIEVARRRLLVVLDNAASSAQLADLLPAAPGSLALVTSRRRLAGLDDVRVESLPVLSPREAVSLLAQIAGDRVRQEPAEAAEVVRLCGYLPLAVRLAGARLAHRPRWRVSDLLRRLGEAALPELAAEDRSVADAFTLTFRQLPAPEQRVFRLLGAYPVAEFDALAAAALTGLSPDEAEDALDGLHDVHLVEEPERGVFRLHDLLRQYAVNLAADLPPDERAAALTALFDFEMHAAMASSWPGHRVSAEHDLRSPRPDRPELLTALGDPAARLERQRPQLAALVEAAGGVGDRAYAWKIPRAAWSHLFHRGYTDDVRDLNLRAMAVLEAEESPDPGAVATVANYLASACGRLAEYAEAERYLRLSIRLREQLGDFRAAVSAYSNLAFVHQAHGRLTEAIDAAMACRRLAARSRRDIAHATQIGNIYEAYALLGRYDEAIRLARLRVLAMIDLGDVALTGSTLLLVQRLRLRQGTLSVAAAHRYVRVGAAMVTRAGYHAGIADGHNDLARLYRMEGRHDEAIEQHRRALAIIRPQHDFWHEARFVCDYATTLRVAGRLGEAREVYAEALGMARRGQLSYTIAQALAGLAACLDPGEPEAERLRQQAGEIFDRMGVRTAERAEIVAPRRE